MANLAPPDADAVLIPCPTCKAWPMAVNGVKSAWPPRLKLRFTCPKCSFSSQRAVDGKSHGSPALRAPLDQEPQ